MRIDSHHHVWDLSVRDQDWMVGDEMAPVRRNFSLADLKPHAAAAGVDHTVLVQTVDVPEETGEFLNIALEDDFVAGVVGWIDLESPTAMSDLARNLDHPGGRKLVSIRDLAQYKDDPNWLARADVIGSIQGLGRRGLSYDLLVQPHQIPSAVAAVEACPDQLFVLDHLAKPHIADGELEPWATSIRELARHHNVACKVSGMVTEARWHGWASADFKPFVDTLLDAFGPDRLMFGSDWPVCLLSASYQQVVDLATELVAGLTDTEAEQFWSGTARRYYRLDDHR